MATPCLGWMRLPMGGGFVVVEGGDLGGVAPTTTRRLNFIEGVSSPESIDHSSGTRWKRLMVSKFARPGYTVDQRIILRFHGWIRHQFGARGKSNSLLPRQVFERGKFGAISALRNLCRSPTNTALATSRLC